MDLCGQFRIIVYLICCCADSISLHHYLLSICKLVCLIKLIGCVWQPWSAVLEFHCLDSTKRSGFGILREFQNHLFLRIEFYMESWVFHFQFSLNSKKKTSPSITTSPPPDHFRPKQTVPPPPPPLLFSFTTILTIKYNTYTHIIYVYALNCICVYSYILYVHDTYIIDIHILYTMF